MASALSSRAALSVSQEEDSVGEWLSQNNPAIMGLSMRWGSLWVVSNPDAFMRRRHNWSQVRYSFLFFSNIHYMKNGKWNYLLSLLLVFLFVSAFFFTIWHRKYSSSSCWVSSYLLWISVSSAVFPAAPHGDSPKLPSRATQLVKNHLGGDFGGMQLHFWSPRTSLPHPQSLQEIWSYGKLKLCIFFQKEKAAWNRNRLVVHSI